MAAAAAAEPAMKRRREILFLDMAESSLGCRHERGARDRFPLPKRRQRIGSMIASIDGRAWRFLRLVPLSGSVDPIPRCPLLFCCFGRRAGSDAAR